MSQDEQQAAREALRSKEKVAAKAWDAFANPRSSVVRGTPGADNHGANEMRTVILAAALIGMSVPSAMAAAPPPPNAKSLSELLQNVERRPGFRYIDEVDWQQGVYEVEYYTHAGAEVEICIDPVSGAEARPCGR